MGASEAGGSESSSASAELTGEAAAGDDEAWEGDGLGEVVAPQPLTETSSRQARKAFRTPGPYQDGSESPGFGPELGISG